jgi:hypothetical protein
VDAVNANKTPHGQPTDAEIEAIVAEALAYEAGLAGSEAQPPSSAIVWWRAQMRARQEATRIADKPIRVVHALSIAAGIGLMLSVIGYAVAGVKGSAGWLTSVAQSAAGVVGSLPAFDLTGRWMAVSLTAALISVIVASVAYVIFADE